MLFIARTPAAAKRSPISPLHTFDERPRQLAVVWKGLFFFKSLPKSPPSTLPVFEPELEAPPSNEPSTSPILPAPLLLPKIDSKYGAIIT